MHRALTTGSVHRARLLRLLLLKAQFAKHFNKVGNPLKKGVRMHCSCPDFKVGCIVTKDNLLLHQMPNPSINTDASDKAAGAGYVKR
jgi:hypothetical protein